MTRDLDSRRPANIPGVFIPLCVLALLATLAMAVPVESAISSTDLAGTWHFYAFADHPTMHAPGWSRGTLVLDAAGSVTGGNRTTDMNLGTTWTGGGLAISPEGLITGSVTDSAGVTYTLTEFKLDAEKITATGVGTDSAGFRFVGTAVQGGGAFSSNDLAGTWYFYTFADHPTMHAPGWSRGMLILDAAGSVTGRRLSTDTGIGRTIPGGALAISPEGLITGSVTDSAGVTYTLTEFKLDSDKTTATGVGTDSAGFRFLGAVIKSAPDQTFTLSVGKTGEGNGTVTSDPAGINCGGTCSAAFTSGTNVTLTATAAANSSFAGWSGEGCSGTGACTVAMTQPRQVTASFACRGITICILPGVCACSAPSLNFGLDGGGGGGGCFIATAAYGSYLDPHVQALRDFRDGHLMTNPAGRVFVGLYEAYSPPVASLIARHGSLKLGARIALTPVVYTIKYPLAAGVSILFIMVLTGWILRAKRRRV